MGKSISYQQERLVIQDFLQYCQRELMFSCYYSSIDSVELEKWWIIISNFKKSTILKMKIEQYDVNISVNNECIYILFEDVNEGKESYEVMLTEANNYYGYANYLDVSESYGIGFSVDCMSNTYSISDGTQYHVNDVPPLIKSIVFSVEDKIMLMNQGLNSIKGDVKTDKSVKERKKTNGYWGTN